MPDDSKGVKATLSTSADWGPWLKAVRKEATRTGFLNHLNNGIRNVALPPIPATERRMQAWRDLKENIESSCDGDAKSFLESHSDRVNLMNAGRLVRFLRDDGEFNIQNLTQQSIATAAMKGVKFHGVDEPKDVLGFLSKMRSKLRELPMKFPPDNTVADPDDQLNHHLVDKLRSWFSPGFHSLIDTIKTTIPRPNFRNLCAMMNARLADLIEQGNYKLENGKAFPTMVELGNNSVGDESGMGQTNRKRQNSESGPGEDCSGFITMSKAAAKRMRKKERERGAAEALAGYEAYPAYGPVKGQRSNFHQNHQPYGPPPNQYAPYPQYPYGPPPQMPPAQPWYPPTHPPNFNPNQGGRQWHNNSGHRHDGGKNGNFGKGHGNDRNNNNKFGNNSGNSGKGNGKFGHGNGKHGNGKHNDRNNSNKFGNNSGKFGNGKSGHGQY